MSEINIIMPKMGESVAEATIIKWVKDIGDDVKLDETIVEIATDKVDSEIPSICSGKLIKKNFQENDVVKVGEVIAIIEDGKSKIEDSVKLSQNINSDISSQKKEINLPQTLKNKNTQNNIKAKSTRFYSPLVRNIANKEKISLEELDKISGSGRNGRVTKNDLLQHIASIQEIDNSPVSTKNTSKSITTDYSVPINDVEIIEMDRMRKIIAKHMIASKSISAHVTSFIELDVTKMVKWRNRIKQSFLEKEGQKITYTPILFESIIKAIIDFPLINISVDQERIIKHKNIHLGMATALENGNLIVPVIKNAQEKNLLGLTKSVNDLATRARKSQLNPDEISGGTFTVTNVGSFGSVMGTPIINQPQVAILALGKIEKKVSVIEKEDGDTIAIRSKMFLSLSYDHRVVDGALGGQFLQRIANYIEQFDDNKKI